MSAQTQTDDRRTADEPTRVTIRMDDLADRVDALAEESDEFENRSEVLREAARRLVTEHECKQRLEDADGVPPNLGGVVDRAPDSHPMTDGGEDL